MPDVPVRQWTPQQLAGITTTGCSLLVSAAAGSGKTAVLAERCVHLVCDARPVCDIDQLLVVTFTEAAAAEMKSRITQSLRRRLDGPAGRSPRLRRQLALVEHAQVSTLHAFCANLLRQHVHLLSLDPDFSILDGDEAALLRVETARKLFDRRYQGDPATSGFRPFVDAFGHGNDRDLMGIVIRAHETLNSLVDPQRWMNVAYARIREGAERPLSSSSLGGELDGMIRAQFCGLQRHASDTLRLIGAMGGFDPYVEHLRALSAIVDNWKGAYERDGLDALARIVGETQIPKLPTIRGERPGKNAARATLERFKKRLKDGALVDVLRFTAEQWRDGLAATLPHAATFLQLVRDFGQEYTRAKRDLRAVDFSDLEQLALRILRQPPASRTAGTGDDWGGGAVDHGDDSRQQVPRPDELLPSDVARRCHEQFAHVLVDEYQDINEVQDAILSLVSHECLRHDRGVVPNFFCVGDVKQSIYRFRLADPMRFLLRQRAMQPAAQPAKQARTTGQTIHLQSNFRSRAPLLDVVNAVFGRLMRGDAVEIDYDQTHALHAGQGYPPPPTDLAAFRGAPVEMHLLPRKHDIGNDALALTGNAPDTANGFDGDLDRTDIEAALVARRIDQLMGRADGHPHHQIAQCGPDGTWQYRPLDYSDIVILLRSMQFKADQFAAALRQRGIPVHSTGGSGFFDAQEVRDVLALLAVLDNPRQDIPLAAVLRSPFAALSNADDALARIRLAYRDGEPHGAPPSGAAVEFHQAVVRYAHEQHDELAGALREFWQTIARWRELARTRPLAELLWTLYDQSGYLTFCSGLPDGAQRVANLIALHERARQYGTFRRQGLYRFLRFMQALSAQTELAQPSVACEAAGTVRIMSIHHAKGLEFPVVIVPDLGKRHNLSDCAGAVLVDRSAYLGLVVPDERRRIRYPSLAHVLVNERIRQQTLAEEMRLLYVAMTRAREHLIFVGTCATEVADQWMSLWAGHCGTLPPETILGAACPLDWIGPVWAILSGAAPGSIELQQHEPVELAGGDTPSDRDRGAAARLRHLAELRPLEPAPAHDPAADAIIARVTATYRFAAFAELPAVVSVTGLTHATSDTPRGGADEQEPASADDPLASLPVARMLAEMRRPSATDRGTATHLFLEHLDFTRACDEMDLALQLDELVTRRLVAPAHARVVDIDGIGWMLDQTPVGRLLRQYAASLRRELPVYLSRRPDETGGARSSDPMDQVMVRGRIDCLVPTAEGIVLIDYKTDHVTADQIDARAAVYRPQLELYARAMRRILGCPIGAAHLVFLHVRQVRSLPGDGDGNIDG